MTASDFKCDNIITVTQTAIKVLSNDWGAPNNLKSEKYFLC